MSPKSLAWVFLGNEKDNTIEVSIAMTPDFVWRRKLNLQTGRALYARCTRKECLEFDCGTIPDPWIAVDELSGAPLVGYA